MGRNLLWAFLTPTRLWYAERSMKQLSKYKPKKIAPTRKELANLSFCYVDLRVRSTGL
jgi:hypothetical protein